MISALNNWHRYFGLALTDFFTGTCYEVEMEKDISIQQQFLDIVVVRKADSNLAPPPVEEMPDGFENLKAHNLISFKSAYEPLDVFALAELTGHMIGYAKEIAKDDWRNFCQNEVGLFAVTVRQPATSPVSSLLIPTDCPDVMIWPGAGFPVQCIILGQAPTEDRNAIWNIFSANAQTVGFGYRHYHWKDPKISTIVAQISEEYLPLGIDMPYTVEDYTRELEERILEKASVEALLRRVTAADVLQEFDPEKLAELRKLLNELKPEQS